MREDTGRVSPTSRHAGRAVGAGVATAALVLLSLNLRPAISSLPPLTGDLQASTGWSFTTIGLITTIPILCMAALAPVVPRLATRWGKEVVAAAALILILIGTAARLAAEELPVVLPISAVFAGVGIAIGAGLAPAFVRAWFPDRIGAMTGLYSGTMILGAALGAGLSVPFMHLTGSWPDALAVWSLLAVAALAVWAVIAVRARRMTARDPVALVPVPHHLPWRSRLAWTLALYLGFNGFVFYSLLAWMAPSYVDRGWSQEQAGLLLALSAVGQMVGALVMPRIAHRFPYRRGLLIGSVLTCLVGTLVIGFVPYFVTPGVIVVQAIGIGGSFALGLMLLSESSPTPGDAARLTALAFLVSYVMSAIGPLVMGAILGDTRSWELFYVILGVMLAAQALVAIPLRRGLTIT